MLYSEYWKKALVDHFGEGFFVMRSDFSLSGARTRKVIVERELRPNGPVLKVPQATSHYSSRRPNSSVRMRKKGSTSVTTPMD